MLRLVVFVLVAELSISAAVAETFRFWPGKGATSAPGFLSVSEHPCGQVATANVTRLPKKARGPLIPEIVVELDRGGKVVRRWPMPVDFYPQAVRGKELLVGFRGTGFWVRSNGKFRRARTIPMGDDRAVPCDLSRVFGKSKYAGCSVFVDIETRKRRTLGFQSVCT